jgi:hypothetical protein
LELPPKIGDQSSLLHRLRMSENRVLRRIFELEKVEVTGGW